VHAVPQQLGHRRALRRGGWALGGGLAHHPDAHGRVADERCHVDADALRIERGEVAGVVLPGPGQTGSQGVERHALDELEEPHERLAMLRATGRHREAAVAHHDGGDAVPRRRARGRIPEELAVVVRVQVDEPRRHHETAGIHLDVSALRDGADGGDAPAGDRDVAGLRLLPGTVAHESTANHEIGHGARL
jgi:hypothetical protein